MNADFQVVIGATDADRRDLFWGAAARLGTPVQNIEKDFWVCWTLDVLFNGLPGGGPRLLFKGGTSLSKAFGLISRFSKDIDITVFREDLGQPVKAIDLDGLTGKKRRAKLDAIRDACRAYIAGHFSSDVLNCRKRDIGCWHEPSDGLENLQVNQQCHPGLWCSRDVWRPLALLETRIKELLQIASGQRIR